MGKFPTKHLWQNIKFCPKILHNSNKYIYQTKLECTTYLLVAFINSNMIYNELTRLKYIWKIFAIFLCGVTFFVNKHLANYHNSSMANCQTSEVCLSRLCWLAHKLLICLWNIPIWPNFSCSPASSWCHQNLWFLLVTALLLTSQRCIFKQVQCGFQKVWSPKLQIVFCWFLFYCTPIP